MTALVLIFSLPAIVLNGGELDTNEQASNWALRTGDGTELGPCTPELCILEQSAVTTSSNWIRLNVPAADIDTDYGLSLRQRIDISNSSSGRTLVLAAWLVSCDDTSCKENLRASVRLVWFNRDAFIGQTEGRSRSLKESGNSDLYVVVQGEIPNVATAVEVYKESFRLRVYRDQTVLTMKCLDGVVAEWVGPGPRAQYNDLRITQPHHPHMPYHRKCLVSRLWRQVLLSVAPSRPRCSAAGTCEELHSCRFLAFLSHDEKCK